MQILLLVSIIVTIGGAVFALQNQITVTMVFQVWRFDSTLALVILLAIAIDACAVALASIPARPKGRWTAKRLRKDLDAAESARSKLALRIVELEAPFNARQAPHPVRQDLSAPVCHPEYHPADADSRTASLLFASPHLQGSR